MTDLIPEDYTHHINWWSGNYYYKRIAGVWHEWSSIACKWRLPLGWYKFYWCFGWRMSVMGKTHKLMSKKAT